MLPVVGSTHKKVYLSVCFTSQRSILRSSSARKFINWMKLESIYEPYPQSGRYCLAGNLILDRIFRKHCRLSICSSWRSFERHLHVAMLGVVAGKVTIRMKACLWHFEASGVLNFSDAFFQLVKPELMNAESAFDDHCIIRKTNHRIITFMVKEPRPLVKPSWLKSSFDYCLHAKFTQWEWETPGLVRVVVDHEVHEICGTATAACHRCDTM